MHNFQIVLEITSVPIVISFPNIYLTNLYLN